eukprot:354009_1
MVPQNLFFVLLGLLLSFIHGINGCAQSCPTKGGPNACSNLGEGLICGYGNSCGCICMPPGSGDTAATPCVRVGNQWQLPCPLPDRTLIGDPTTCATIRYQCEQDYVPWSDAECGCGCMPAP